MNKHLSKLLCFLLVAISLFTLTSCKKEESSYDKNVLRIYNWQDYIDDGLDDDGNKVRLSVTELWQQDFYNRTGRNVEVVYDTFETPEIMLNQIKTGKEFDLICPSDYTIQKMLKEDMLEPFDEGALDDGYLKHVSPYLKDLFEENGWTNYAACYMWGTLGLIYNTDVISEEDVMHWKVMWDEKYKGQISTKDSVRDTYFMGVMYIYQEELIEYRNQFITGAITSDEYNKKINEIANFTDDATLRKVEEELKKLKQNIFGLEVDSGKSDIVTGKIAMNLAWSGDAVYSMDLADEEGITLAYSVPEEGSNVWFDGWCMPKGANKELAQDFINFVAKPEIAALNMSKIGYTTSSVGDEIFDLINDWYGSEEEEPEFEVDLSFYFGDSLSDDRLTDGKAIVYTDELGRQFSAQYPTEDILYRCGIMRDFGDKNRDVLKMWSSFKSNSLSPVAYILLAIIVLTIIVVYVIHLVDKAKKNARRKKFRESRK